MCGLACVFCGSVVADHDSDGKDSTPHALAHRRSRWRPAGLDLVHAATVSFHGRVMRLGAQVEYAEKVASNPLASSTP